MRVISDLGQVKAQFKRPVVAIGIFDGLHLGHQFLLKKAVFRAKKIKGTSVVVTFYPHPSHVLAPKKELTFLISLKERLRLLKRLGVEVCVVIEFSRRFSQIKSEVFLQNHLIAKLHPQEIFVGEDFVFGSDRKGNIELLQKLGKKIGFKVRAIPPVKVYGLIVSSTLIRGLVKRGQLFKVGRMLNRLVTISGRVIKGVGKGKRLGFPTVNIKDYEGMLPGYGVYVVRVLWRNNRYFGMAFIGRRPKSLKIKGAPLIEANIFNFNRSIYGEEISVEFLKKIREEKEFTNDSNLAAQLKKDLRSSQRIISAFRY
ncbi:MAG: bifunctional riboflavin kinase/FAD synthetase [Candidatus Omnitrophota bacterium]|nr:bifunctional riboflavin kinase/FAD synthetase [Candidatus Omnitrophota bacterium]